MTDSTAFDDDDPTRTNVRGTCPACDAPVAALEYRFLPLEHTTFADGACVIDAWSADLPIHPDFFDWENDVAVVTHLGDGGEYDTDNESNS